MTESIIFADKPISIFQSAGMNGKPSRQLFIDIADLASVPEELFALKVSQSKNPELAVNQYSSISATKSVQKHHSHHWLHQLLQWQHHWQTSKPLLFQN